MNDDKNLTASDVQTLASRDGVVAFFATLGYNTDSRQPQSADAMGITAESLKRQVAHIERIAFHSDDVDTTGRLPGRAEVGHRRRDQGIGSRPQESGR